MDQRWCPECGDEFRPGFDTCPDCRVALVDVEPERRSRVATGLQDHREVEYDFEDWPELWRDALTLLLRGTDIPFAWEGPGMLVAPLARQEEIEDLIETIDGTVPEPDTTPSVSTPDRYEPENMSPWTSFQSDLTRAARAWRRSPGLPLVSAAITAASAGLCSAASDDPGFALVAILVSIVTIGFSGTQRIWYLRAFARDPFPAAEIAPLTWQFLGRFLALGALVTFVSFPLHMVALALGREAFVVTTVAWSFALDVVLTFVAPALAYTTRSVLTALRIGRRMVADTWPSSRWYSLTPGMASTFVVFVWPHILDLGGQIVLGATLGLLALWFKGAIAAYYLRQQPAISTGSAYADGDLRDLRYDDVGSEA